MSDEQKARVWSDIQGYVRAALEGGRFAYKDWAGTALHAAGTTGISGHDAVGKALDELIVADPSCAPFGIGLPNQSSAEAVLALSVATGKAETGSVRRWCSWLSEECSAQVAGLVLAMAVGGSDDGRREAYWSAYVLARNGRWPPDRANDLLRVTRDFGVRDSTWQVRASAVRVMAAGLGEFGWNPDECASIVAAACADSVAGVRRAGERLRSAVARFAAPPA